ncbi:MAG: DUF192 domain-containing protein [Proteobacteria bacterium]|nr:DUF192 domain-containing protein [Pseudomonadota bacterium]
MRLLKFIKKINIGLLICLQITILFVSTVSGQRLDKFKAMKIKADGRELNVFVADTQDKRQQGLSGTDLVDLKRKNIDGMLFMFEDDSEKTFQAWYMKYDLMLLILERVGKNDFIVKKRVPLRIGTTVMVKGMWVLEIPLKKD